jgi:uncharacterized phage-associated protein
LNWKTEEMASYIVNYHLLKGKTITQQKLQKFLYLIDIRYSVDGREKTYENEKVEYWQLGAVYPKVYELIRTTAVYDGNLIHSPAKRLGFNYSSFEMEWIDFPEPNLTEKEKTVINSILDKYIDWDQFDFVEEVFKINKMANIV